MKNTARLTAFLATAALLCSSLSYAEGVAVPAEKVGNWHFSMGDGSAAKGGQKLKAALQDISRMIAATQVMTPPKGFEVRFWGSISPKDRFDICKGKKCPPARPGAVLATMIGRYEAKGGAVKAAFNSPSTMDISINNLGHVFAHLPVVGRDSAGFFLPEPVEDGVRAGFRTFMNRGHAVAVITSNESPLWLPVSRERYLQAAIITEMMNIPTPVEPQKKVKKGKKGAKTVADEPSPSGMPMFVEEGRTWIDPAEERLMIEKSRHVTESIKEEEELIRERIKQLQAELDAMPQEHKGLQARVDVSKTDMGTPPLLPVDSSSGSPVVTPNFGYFNPKLPVETPQIAVIQWKFDGETRYDPEKTDISSTLNNRVLQEIYKTMEWQKLRGKITRTAP